MANRYWVGGTNNWNGTAGTKWSETSGGAGGASEPTSADDVFFDGNSGTVTVTVSTSTRVCRTLNFTGFTGTFAGSTALQIHGSLIAPAGFTRTYTGSITFLGSGSWNIEVGVIWAGLWTLDNVSGEWSLSSNLEFTLGNATISLLGGTFNTDNYDLIISDLISSGSVVRTLNLGSSYVYLRQLVCPAASNLTVNAGTSTIHFGQAPNNITSNLGNFSYHILWIDNHTRTLINLASFYSLELFPVDSVLGTLMLGNSFTVTTTFKAIGTSSIPLYIAALENTVTIEAEEADLGECTFINITGAGEAVWAGTRIGDGGFNTNITFDSPRTLYKVGGTGSWTNSSMWSASSGGAGGAELPLMQDTIIYDANSFSANGQTFTIPAVVLKIDLLNVPFNITLLTSVGAGGDAYIYDSFLLKSTDTLNLGSATKGLIFLNIIDVDCVFNNASVTGTVIINTYFSTEAVVHLLAPLTATTFIHRRGILKCYTNTITSNRFLLGLGSLAASIAILLLEDGHLVANRASFSAVIAVAGGQSASNYRVPPNNGTITINTNDLLTSLEINRDSIEDFHVNNLIVNSPANDKSYKFFILNRSTSSISSSLYINNITTNCDIGVCLNSTDNKFHILGFTKNPVITDVILVHVVSFSGTISTTAFLNLRVPDNVIVRCVDFSFVRTRIYKAGTTSTVDPYKFYATHNGSVAQVDRGSNVAIYFTEGEFYNFL